MTNANWNEVGKALLRGVEAGRLEQYLKEPLKESITPLLGSDGLPLSESTDPISPILLLIFTHIDLLGYLYKGRDPSPSRDAVEFIREYLGRVDKRYEKVGGLLYDALRHGYVHLVTPKRILLKNGVILDFSFVTGGHPGKHLTVINEKEIEREGRLEIYRLFVNLSQLYEDLLSAMDIYAEDIRHNQDLSDVFQKSFETRRKPEKAKEEVLLRKSYIQQSDFDFVREQISRL